jgi:translation initiation factor IF-1
MNYSIKSHYSEGTVDYGIITAKCTGVTFKVQLMNQGAEVIGHIRKGCFRVKKKDKQANKLKSDVDKKIKFNLLAVNDIVLVGLRDYQPTHGDIIEIYDYKRVLELVKMGEIPKDIKKKLEVEDPEYESKVDECPFDFEAI